MLGRDGDRATVIARYRDDHLPFQPGLLARLGELRGKALGCWCAPEECHADLLVQEMKQMTADLRSERARREAMDAGRRS